MFFCRQTIGSDSNGDPIGFNDSVTQTPKDVFDVIDLKEMERKKKELERMEAEILYAHRRTPSGGGGGGGGGKIPWGNNSFNDVRLVHVDWKSITPLCVA